MTIDIKDEFVPIEDDSNEEEFVEIPNTGIGGYIRPLLYGTEDLPQEIINVNAGSLRVDDASYFYGDVNVEDNLYVKGPLWDKNSSKGSVGQVLISDSAGVFWGDISGVGTPLQTIGVYDENTFQGIVANLNFRDGTDPDNLVKVQIGVNTAVADIFISDRWSLSGSNIYRNSKVGINNNAPTFDLDVVGDTKLNGNLTVTGTVDISGFTFIDDNVIISGFTTGTISTAVYAGYAQTAGIATNAIYAGYAQTAGIATVSLYSINSGVSTFIKTTNTFDDKNYYLTFVENYTSQNQETIRVDAGIKYNPDKNSITLDGPLSIGGTSLFQQSIELKSSLIDSNGSTAVGKTDYRLASVGTGVSWRPPGVQTKRAIWVTMNGNDSNTGLLEGDAKRTVGAAASIAQEGDTIFVRSGVYYENNPIGLRTDVSVSGQDLRLVTIIPNNPIKDVFHVRRGCLIENVNFAGSSVSIAHTGCGAVAFPPTSPSEYAISGYISPGPANEGPSGRWRSPYIRNCTNFMTKSIGMKINGDHATGITTGADLKSMVCDSFTQYNENGIGVSITNNGYAQLVSIFTINCDIGIYCDSGGSCDLTNSNSSFGNFGLVAVGLGSTEFTGKVNQDTLPGLDTIVLKQVYDGSGTARRPYDGQALWFKINLDNYPDAVGVGTITSPMQELSSITVLNGGSGYSENSPPNVIIRDNDGTLQPKGPQGIIAQASATVDETGKITTIDVISTGRNYLSTQNIIVEIEGDGGELLHR